MPLTPEQIRLTLNIIRSKQRLLVIDWEQLKERENVLDELLGEYRDKINNNEYSYEEKYSEAADEIWEVRQKLMALVKKVNRLAGKNRFYSICWGIVGDDRNHFIWGIECSKRKMREYLKIVGSGYQPLWALEKWGNL
jgi:hypothetical protein